MISAYYVRHKKELARTRAKTAARGAVSTISGASPARRRRRRNWRRHWKTKRR